MSVEWGIVFIAAILILERLNKLCTLVGHLVKYEDRRAGLDN